MPLALCLTEGGMQGCLMQEKTTWIEEAVLRTVDLEGEWH